MAGLKYERFLTFKLFIVQLFIHSTRFLKSGVRVSALTQSTIKLEEEEMDINQVITQISIKEMVRREGNARKGL